MTQHLKNDVEVVDSQQFDTNDEQTLVSLQNILDYNTNINEHLPCYATFKPNDKFLVRYFRRMPILLDNGMFINEPTFADFAKVSKIADSGQQYTLKEIATEFSFADKVVVVSTPPYNPNGIKVGDIQVTTTPVYEVTKIDGTEYCRYMGAFLHPDSNMNLPTHDCTNPHYGYALVPSNLLLGGNE